MSPTITAILTLAVLTAWHLRTRRHPYWAACRDARFYITIGYPAVAIAVYWLSQATTTDGFEWALGNLWALAAMVMFVHGFNALRAACEQQKHASKAIETTTEDSPRPQWARPGLTTTSDPTSCGKVWLHE